MTSSLYRVSITTPNGEAIAELSVLAPNSDLAILKAVRGLDQEVDLDTAVVTATLQNSEAVPAPDSAVCDKNGLAVRVGDVLVRCDGMKYHVKQVHTGAIDCTNSYDNKIFSLTAYEVDGLHIETTQDLVDSYGAIVKVGDTIINQYTGRSYEVTMLTTNGVIVRSHGVECNLPRGSLQKHYHVQAITENQKGWKPGGTFPLKDGWVVDADDIVVNKAKSLLRFTGRVLYGAVYENDMFEFHLIPGDVIFTYLRHECREFTRKDSDKPAKSLETWQFGTFKDKNDTTIHAGAILQDVSGLRFRFTGRKRCFASGFSEDEFEFESLNLRNVTYHKYFVTFSEGVCKTLTLVLDSPNITVTQDILDRNGHAIHIDDTLTNDEGETSQVKGFGMDSVLLDDGMGRKSYTPSEVKRSLYVINPSLALGDHVEVKPNSGTASIDNVGGMLGLITKLYFSSHTADVKLSDGDTLHEVPVEDLTRRELLGYDSGNKSIYKGDHVRHHPRSRQYVAQKIKTINGKNHLYAAASNDNNPQDITDLPCLFFLDPH